MTLTIGRNRNTNDVAVVTTFVLNSTTATKVADANPNRIFFHFSAEAIGMNSAFVRLYPAGDDNLKRGMNMDFWEMPPDINYTGEISAIAKGPNITVHATEY